MQRGPFGHWRHVHLFEAVDGGTKMRDQIDFASPYGPLGRLFDSVFLEQYMIQLIERRNAHLTRVAETSALATRVTL
jgi:ligand-binding SRPBCC domain-containing protein